MVVPEAHLKWTHEFLDNPQTLLAEFQNIPGGSFQIIDRKLPDDGGSIGVGITGYQNQMAFNINYQYEFGRSDYKSHVFDVGLKINF